MNADVPEPWGTETPRTYAQRLLRLWATDAAEADDVERTLGPRKVRPDRVAEDVVELLAEVRESSGEEHCPMVDCGHCWAERNGQPSRGGVWSVVVCDECDEPWPCSVALGRDDTPNAG